MPLRRTSDGQGAVFYTGICDRCLRIGPTHRSVDAALTEGRFGWGESTTVMNGTGPPFVHRALLCALLRDCELPEEIPRGGGTPSLRILPPHSCTACGFNGKSRWERLRGVTPYKAAEPCPKCGHQWHPPRTIPVERMAPQAQEPDILTRMQALLHEQQSMQNAMLQQQAAMQRAPRRGEGAIVAFQQLYGLATDGLIGEATRRQLLGSRWVTRQAHAVAVVQDINGDEVTLNTGVSSHRFQLANLFQLFDPLGPEEGAPRG